MLCFIRQSGVPHVASHLSHVCAGSVQLLGVCGAPGASKYTGWTSSNLVGEL